jgi:hypothetical protein
VVAIRLRRVLVDRPFIQGMITDQPAHKLGSQNSVFAQDLVAPVGIATQRHGWEYDGTTADAASNSLSVFRNKFILADVTQTLTSAVNGTVNIHNPSSAGTIVYSTGTFGWLPRCVYKDQVIWCAQDGFTPIIRFSGVGLLVDSDNVSPTTTANQAILTTPNTWAAAVTSGAYVRLSSDQSQDCSPFYYPRVLERISSTVLTLEDTRTSLAGAQWATEHARGAAFTYPCVPVYQAGTGTLDSINGRVDGAGTNWVDASTVSVQDQDGFLVLPSTGSAAMYQIGAVDSTTRISFSGNVSRSDADTAYAIMRRCPFTDAAAHKGSLWGTGVAAFPNNVYVAPPGWDPAYPPGATYPFDPSVFYESENVNDFTLTPIAVPTAYEGDVNVAILSTPNPLLVLKRSAVHGIYGAFPSFSQDKIADGVGCIDKRSAISGPFGQFWAGEDDVYAYINGQVIPLMEGKISREWQSLIADFDYGTTDYCAIGESLGHLFVSIVTGAGATNRCYVYDIRNQAWISRFSNHQARYFFSSKVDGEPSELYWVGDSYQGRVMKSSGAVALTSDAKDDNGTSPRMQAWSPEGIDGTETLDNDARLLDLAVAHNVYDASAAGSTSVAVSVVAGGSLEANASATKTLSDIDSDTVDRVDRTRFRSVNTKGRIQQVRFDADTLGTNTAASKVEIHELTGTFRDRRSRT